MKAKQIIISNVGQIQGTWSNLKDKYNLSYLLIIMNNKLCPLLISFLSFLNLIPKIDIRFLSNKSLLESIKNSMIKNFCYTNNLFHTKKSFLLIVNFLMNIMRKKLN